ncbi:MAG TPA: SBBP repeat-containing protein, partial [Candidatus Absconditabacterales bacterium]|nr:SBBP repeat-containing protein [Candidatus Absconditabacterales bacterium]
TKISPTGDYLRAIQGGGISNDGVGGIGIDNQGNIYIAGYFLGTATFGPTTLISNGGYDFFITKLSPVGDYLRTTQGGGNEYNIVDGIVVDNLGNSYIAGDFVGTTNFGGIVLVSNAIQNTFVAKLSSTGEYLRAVKGGGNDPDNDWNYGVGLSMDNGGNSYIAGNFGGTANFGSTILISSNNVDNTFIAKLSSTGEYLRAIQGEGQISGIGVDSLGNSYIAGNFDLPTLSLGSTTLINNDPSTDTNDIFIEKISSAGEYLGVIQGGGIDDDYANGITIDNEGNSYIVGSFMGTATFGSLTLTSSNSSYSNAFIAKIGDIFTGSILINNGAASTTVTGV